METPPAAISMKDIERETRRAEELETMLDQKEGLLQDFLAPGTPAGAEAVLNTW